MWLSKKKTLILNSLIEIYIHTLSPVSSIKLSNKLKTPHSSIRKELQELESLGFIYKNTNHSGRIPTNKGLKFYLNQIVNSDITGDKDLKIPDMDTKDFSSIANNFLNILSNETNNMGIVFLRSIFDLRFNSLRLIKIAPYRVMILIKSLRGWNFSKIINTLNNYSDIDLRNWENILNKEFTGKNLKQTFKIIRNRLSKEKEKFIKIYRQLYYLLANESLTTAEIFYKGSSNILDISFINQEKLKSIIKALEEKERFSEFLNDILKNKNKETKIIFGSDTGIKEFEDFILIFSQFYHTKTNIGDIGIMGPKFMQYEDTIFKIKKISEEFSSILSGINGGKQ